MPACMGLFVALYKQQSRHCRTLLLEEKGPRRLPTLEYLGVFESFSHPFSCCEHTTGKARARGEEEGEGLLIIL